MISKEELQELYWGESGTEIGCTLIAKEYNCHPQTIYNYLRKYNIDIRPATSLGNGDCIKDTARNVQREALKEKVKSGKLNFNNMLGKKHKKETINKLSEINSGKGNFNSKLTKKDCLKIYNEYKENNISQKKLGKKYSVSKNLVWRIVNGKHWATKGFEAIEKDNKVILRGKEHPKSKIDKKTGMMIYNEYKNKNVTQKELGNKYKVTRSTVGYIVRCEHWTTEHLT